MSTRTTSTQCSPVSVKVKRCVSVLPNDYSQLENMPTINGVTLIDDLKANELGVLSSNKNDYETLSVLDQDIKDNFVVVLGDGKVSKVSLDEFLEQAGSGGTSRGNGFKTVDVIDIDIPVGAYQFVEKK